MKANRIYPYKNRIIDFNRDVEVYRCLVRKGHIYSIRQDSKVVGHTDALTLINVTMHVNLKGNDRAKKTGERNVHAYIKGRISNITEQQNDALYLENVSNSKFLSNRILYKPFIFGHFTNSKRIKVTSADRIVINKNGVFAHIINQ